MRINVEITRRRVPITRVLAAVADISAGCTAAFIGAVRKRSGGMRVERMEIEAAEDLAEADLIRIAKLASKKYDVLRIYIVHRVGRLRVGDTIVAIAVSAPHREEAFSACRFVIDELKRTTPIWKKEICAGRERWVGPET